MNAYLNVMHTTTCNCAACAPVPTLGIKMPYEEEKKELVKTRNQAEKINLSQNTSCYLLQSKYTICIKINKTQHS